MIERIICWFDGACHPENPGGNMGIGVAIDIGTDVIELSECIGKNGGHSSSNLAEYHALNAGLLWINEAIKFQSNVVDITIYGDSKMVINQLNNVWGISNTKIYSTKAKEVCSLYHIMSRTCKIRSKWIPREQNTHADYLSKEAISKCLPIK